MAMEPQFTIPQNPECVRNPESKIPTRIPDYPNNHLKSMVCGTIRNPEPCRIRSAPDSQNTSIKTTSYDRIRNPVFPTLKGVCPPLRLGHTTDLFLVWMLIPDPIQTGPP